MDSSIIERIAAAVDPEEATPLYDQLVQVVKWEIDQGRLPIGTVLPPIREVAAVAAVNYHTVRRAWGELERDGVIDQRRGRGARVVRAPSRGSWSPAGGVGVTGDCPRVWVVAAGLEAAAHLAGSLGDRWVVEAIPWPLTAQVPPPGPILCTSEAYPAALATWPLREGDLRPLATVPDPATLGVLRRNAALLGVARVRIHADPADPAARELQRQLPRLGLRAAIVAEDAGSLDLGGRSEAVQLYFPAAWAQLSWGARMRPDTVAVELDWAAGPLAGVARELGLVARA